jgi:hypothetical protein
LNPPKAGVSVGSSLAALLLVAYLSLTVVVNAVNAQPIQVSKVPYVFNADIAFDPTNPERIAVTINKAEKYDCKYILCQTTSLLYSSSDGGRSWQEQDPYGKQLVYNAIQPEFDEAGRFYTVTNIGFDGDATSWVYVTRADEMVVEKNDETRLEGETYGAKIAIHPQTGTLYMVYFALEDVTPDFSSGVPEFRTSLDGGETWSEPTRVVKKPVWEINEGYPFEADIFLGDDERLAVVWTQDDGTFAKTIDGGTNIYSSNYVPHSVWIVLSNDGGKTFTEPRRVGESWGRVATAYLGDAYYIMTKQASFQTEQVTFEYRLLYSQNKGVSWNVASISRNVEVYASFPYEVKPGLSVSPDGTLDVVFYAHTTRDCISSPAIYNSAWTDRCSYNVYHAYSKDDGTTLRTFTDPQKINPEPIVGSQFVLLNGLTLPPFNIGIASTNEAAYPVWIGNREGVEGTQAYMMRIER